MSTMQRFARFQRQLVPDTDETRDALSRAVAVGRSLHKYYFPGQNFPADSVQVIGSYGKDTTVRPVRDVDVLFKIPASTWLRFTRYSGNGQSALLQEVRGQLLKTFPRSDIRGDGPAVKVLFTSGHYVEVIPAFKDRARAGYLVPRTTGGGLWARSDYDQEQRTLNASDHSTGGQTRRLIRMLKAWQQHCNVPIRSLALELRSQQFLRTWACQGETETYDDWMLRDFFSELTRYANSVCTIPGIPEQCHYGDAWLAHATRAHQIAALACRYEVEDPRMACLTWRRLLGDDFGA